MIWHDVLIVGRGIAGNTLALTLLEQGARIKVVDNPNSKCSSRIAAGIFNPFTGKRTVKTWLADDLFPFLLDFYSRIEKKTGMEILHQRPIYRPFLSNEDYNDWVARSTEEDYSSFVNPNPNHAKFSPWIHNPTGGLECKQSGYIDTMAYLNAGENILKTHQALVEEAFLYADLNIIQDGVSWKGSNFRYVIFCEGVYGMKNPFFPNFPLAPNKGEILSVSIPEYPLTEIISKGVFLVQKKASEFVLGSTYRWSFEHEEPEERGAEELLLKLHKWFKAPVKQLKLVAGIRPATRDRRPLLGFLDNNPAVLIFNGLGTKGVSLAPFWANHLCQFILHQKDLDSEVDIRRFYVN